VQSGRYAVTQSGQLTFADPQSLHAPKPIGNDGIWGVARCIAADKHWLYINANGSLYRVRPDNGTHEPYGPFEEATLQRAIWLQGDVLYGVIRAKDADTGHFADINCVELAHPNKLQQVARRVRMDLPATVAQGNNDVYLDVP
jgi:hypothetical protein